MFDLQTFQNKRENDVTSSYLYAFFTLNHDDAFFYAFEALNDLTPFQDTLELLPDVWIFSKHPSQGFVFPEGSHASMVLYIPHIHGISYQALAQILRSYKRNPLFYDFHFSQRIYRKSIEELTQYKGSEKSRDFMTIKKDWLSFQWIHDQALFQKLLAQLQTSRMPYTDLYCLLLSIVHTWHSSYASLSEVPLSFPDSFLCWEEVERWLLNLYESIRILYANSSYSPEITQTILKAKQYADSHYNAPIRTEEMAHRANMSYGYFCQCFQTIIGESFYDYRTRLRLKKAKHYLLHTSYSIQQISYSIGYRDEKYFGRVFKKHTGYSPSQYRKNYTS